MFDWITGLMEGGGALVVALLMFAENLFPPIPSELIMPLAGFAAAQGEASLAVLILAGSAGSLAGAALYYWIGATLGMDRLERLAARHGRWLTLTPEELRRAADWFRRHGTAAVFLGRLVPGIRTLISVPAGVSRLPLAPFLAYSAAGTVLWTSFLAGAGYLLESQYDRVAAWLNPVSNVVIAALALIYLWRVVTYGRRAPSSRSKDPAR